jgi:hypothetical protein
MTELGTAQKTKAATKRFRKAHPEWWKWMCWKGRLKREYGMTEQDFKRMLEEQGGCCAICHRPLLLGDTYNICVDHKHGHKRPRGLVHRNCNALLGYAEDNAIILRLAAEYLEAYEMKHAEEQPCGIVTAHNANEV